MAQTRSRSAPAKGRSTAAKKKAAQPSVFQGHEADLVGIALILVAILLALATYADLAGPLGRGLDSAVGALVGVGRYFAPLALAGLGIACITGIDPGEGMGRLFVGSSLLAVAAVAGLHVLKGPDAFPGTHGEVTDAGGWVGAALGQPLQALLSPVGAALVVIAVMLAAALLITQASLRTAAVAVGSAVAPVGRALSARLSDVTTLRDDRDADDHDHVIDVRETPALYDRLADDDEEPASEPAPAPKAKRARAAKIEAPGGPTEQLEIDLGPGAQRGAWKLPALGMLERTAAQTIDEAEVLARGRTLEQALASHGVETRLKHMTVGPTVTRYELELGPGVRVIRVTSLNKDIAYAMAAEDVRILAPIPGKQAIGVEVPNKTRSLVSLGDLLVSREAAEATHPLEVAVGKDINGRAVMVNLATTPHMLVAGATGAGKSSFINSLLTSLLMRSTPDQVRLILIDPKRVEMGQYNQLPHLLTQVVTSPKKAANALSWAVKEMERRYDLLHEVGTRDITGYNSMYDRGELRPEVDDYGNPTMVYERLPFIVLVVDELNDLMMVAARDVEETICRIAQMARAVGIHLVIATQRPSVNVITGVIKANIPSRVAFAVSSQTDSKVILDQVGAERLVGKGDMLLLPGSSSVAQRVQGAWVSEEEIRKITNFWRNQTPSGPEYVDGVDGGDDEGGGNGDLGGLVDVNSDDADDETLVRQAIELVVRSQLGSTSMLQRKLKVGFARAGRIMDLLEQRGVVGPSEGSKARAVMMTVDELEALIEGDRNR